MNEEDEKMTTETEGGKLSVSITEVPWETVCWASQCANKPVVRCLQCGMQLCGECLDEHLKEHLAHEGEEVKKAEKEGGHKYSLSNLAVVAAHNVNDIEISNFEGPLHHLHLTYWELKSLARLLPGVNESIGQRLLQVLDERLDETKKQIEKLQEERKFLVKEIENSKAGDDLAE